MAGRPPVRGQKGKEKKSSMIGNLMFFGFIVAVAVVVIVMLMKPTDHPVLSKQGTPEGALEAYLMVASSAVAESPNFDHMSKAVRKQDYKWFQDNYMQIFEGNMAEQVADMSSAADPSKIGHLARRVALSMICGNGPHRGDAETMSSNVSGNTAEFVVRQRDYRGDGSMYVFDYKVRLAKEGKYWKVADFANGRAVYEKRTQPGDIVEVDPSTVGARGGGAVAEDASMGADPAFAAVEPSIEMGMPMEALGGAPQFAPAPAPGFAPVNVSIQAPPKSPFPGGHAAPSAAILAQMPPLSDGELLIGQASIFWQKRQFQESLDAAQKALIIHQHHLGPNHQKCAQVRQMVTMAQQQIAAANSQASAGAQSF